MPYQSIFTPNNQRNFSQDFKPGQYAKVNAAATKKNNQQNNLLLQQSTQKPQGSSLFSKLKRVALDVGKGTEKAGAAVVRPIADIVTGKGGKAVHDNAQLASDITGGSVNQLAKAARYTPQMIAADVTNNPKAQQSTQRKAFGTTDSGKIAKKIIGSTAGTASLFVGGGEAKTAATGGKLLFKDLLTKGGSIQAAKEIAPHAVKSGIAGGVGNEGALLSQNPDASEKELGKAGLIGLGAGIALPFVGRLFGLGARAALAKLKGSPQEAKHAVEAGMEDVMTPEQADKAAAAQYTKITPEDQSTGEEKVGIKTPVHPGIKQTSTTYKVGVRAAQPMSDSEYTKQFNTLSNAYEKEMHALKGKGAETQKAVAEHIDKKYQALINDLNDNYKNGVMPKETTVKKVAAETSQPGRTTGGIPKTGVNVQSEAYKVGAASRIKPEEAAAKLKAAGYSADETKTILSDALSEKGLSMPGSSKKIGLNDASVKQSAANFDKQKAPVETQPTVVTPVEKTATSASTPTEGTNLKPLQSVEANPEQGTSKLGTSVREKALQDKLISKTEAESQDLPTYNKANMKEQATYATDLIKSNPEQAVNIALGKAEAPAHILPQMVYNAVEEYARGLGGEDGAKLLLDLSRSKQVSSLTTMAQNVRAAAERDPHSPTNMINDVATTRAKALEKRGKSVGKIAQNDAAAIKKVTPKVTKDDWTAFVDGLRC